MAAAVNRRLDLVCLAIVTRQGRGPPIREKPVVWSTTSRTRVFSQAEAVGLS